MNRLPCDNLYDFIDGFNTFYAVDDNSYQVGDRVILYNEQHEHEFVITHIYHLERTVLALKGVRYFEALLVHSEEETESG